MNEKRALERQRIEGHTPGPWRWDDGYPNGNGEDTWSLIGSDGYGILSCDMPNAPQNCNKMDAELIANTPELEDDIETLQQLVREAAWLVENAGSPVSASWERVSEWCDRRNALLVKLPSSYTEATNE